MDKSEKNWNFKIANRISRWLSKHKTNQHWLMVNYESPGTAEVRMYNADPLNSRAVISIRIYGVADLVVDAQRKTGNKRCYCYAELRDTLADWLKEELKTNQNKSKKRGTNNG